MGQRFHVHPQNPQPRLIRQAIGFIRNGGVIAYPTDSGYALGCHIGDHLAKERMIRIRQLDERHHFTLMCRDLKEAGLYARFETPIFRLLKAHTPGPYTFILEATREVPRRLLHPKRKSIGIRIPSHPITQALLEELDEPLLTTTLILPGESEPMHDPDEIQNRLGREIDLLIDGGPCGTIPTSVIDLRQDPPQILRIGKGDVTPFLRG